MDISNLNSLKVTDLKQLLKARGLSIVGVKSELIQRLETAMLNDSNTGASAVNISKEIDEDAILGDDDESFPTKSDESLIHNEDLLLSENSVVTSNPSNPPSSTITTSAVPKTTTAPNPTTATSANPSAPVVAKATTAPEAGKAVNTVSTLKQLAGSKNVLTPEQKKQMRLLKFADPKLRDRAERFGAQLSKPATLTEDDKLKQRMQRFGEAVSEKAKTLEEKERIEKRKERFGQIKSEPTSGSGSSNGFKRPVDEKIQKRQERFGVVDDSGTKDTNRTLPGFKRRRFAF